MPLRVRSLVGLLPLIAVEVLEDSSTSALPAFKRRMQWFLENRRDLAAHVSLCDSGEHGHMLLAIPSHDRLTKVLRTCSTRPSSSRPTASARCRRRTSASRIDSSTADEEFRVDYVPGESNTGLFGGNSNWRGPIWFPVNYLLVEALERYHHFYGDEFRVECPAGSGKWLNLKEVAREISSRLARIFLPDADGHRPCHAGERRFADDPHWRELVLFHEYFHGDTGRGVGASHQTGWTALAIRFIEDIARARAGEKPHTHPARLARATATEISP